MAESRTTYFMSLLSMAAALGFVLVDSLIGEDRDVPYVVGRLIGTLVMGLLIGLVSRWLINRRAPDHPAPFSTVLFIAAAVIVGLQLLNRLSPA